MKASFIFSDVIILKVTNYLSASDLNRQNPPRRSGQVGASRRLRPATLRILSKEKIPTTAVNSVVQTNFSVMAREETNMLTIDARKHVHHH